MKLDGKDELTKQYDVALKILKTKVEKSEDVAETEENIKGLCPAHYMRFINELGWKGSKTLNIG